MASTHYSNPPYHASRDETSADYYPQDHRRQPHQPPPTDTWNPRAIWEAQNGTPSAPSSSSSRQAPRAGKVYDGNEPGIDYRANGPVGAGHTQGPPGEGERGLGATVLGGAGGAFLGHETHHGALGTMAGLAAGAIAANMFEHHEKKKHEERRERHAYDDGYYNGEAREEAYGYRHGHGHGHRGSRSSRGLDDEDEYRKESRYEDERSYVSSRSRDVAGDDVRYLEDDREYEPPRHHHHHHHRDYDDDDDENDDEEEDERDFEYSRRGSRTY